MSVRLRLTRMGRKKRPFYRIVAVDSRKKRDGAFLERLGFYHPLYEPPTVEIDADRTLYWLRCGAQPSEAVLNLLKREGIWLRFTLEKKGLPPEEIQKRVLKWFEQRGRKMKWEEGVAEQQSQGEGEGPSILPEVAGDTSVSSQEIQ